MLVMGPLRQPIVQGSLLSKARSGSTSPLTLWVLCKTAGQRGHLLRREALASAREDLPHSVKTIFFLPSRQGHTSDLADWHLLTPRLKQKNHILSLKLQEKKQVLWFVTLFLKSSLTRNRGRLPYLKKEKSLHTGTLYRTPYPLKKNLRCVFVTIRNNTVYPPITT